MPTPFEDLSWSGQCEQLERLQAAFDGKVAEGPLGGLVLRLRVRADKARTSAQVFLWMLLISVVLGLAFYLGLPVWQTWTDSQRETLQGTLDEIEAQKLRLDGDREFVRLDLVATLNTLAKPVREGAVDDLGIGRRHEDIILRMSRDGLIVSIDEEWKIQAAGLALRPGIEGDETLERFMVFDLPGDAANLLAVGSLRDRLKEIVATRTALTLLAELAGLKRDRIASTPLYLRLGEKVQMAFSDFLTTCRGTATPPDKDLTKDCLTA